MKYFYLLFLLLMCGCSSSVKYVYITTPPPTEKPDLFTINYQKIILDDKKFYCVDDEQVDLLLFNQAEMERFSNTNYNILKELHLKTKNE